jgi:hypothetical protein
MTMNKKNLLLVLGYYAKKGWSLIRFANFVSFFDNKTKSTK